MIQNTQAVADLRGGQDVFDAGGLIAISADVNMQQNISKHKRAFTEKVAQRILGVDQPLTFFDGLSFELRSSEEPDTNILYYNGEEAGKIVMSDIELNSVRFMFIPIEAL